MKLFDMLRKTKNKAENGPSVVEQKIIATDPIEEILEKATPVAEAEIDIIEESEESIVDGIESGSAEELTGNFLLGLLYRMDSEAKTDITAVDSNTINVKLVGGKDPGRLIGRRGETLDAIQRITNSVVNHRDTSEHYHIRIDAEGYHEKREEQLRVQAKRTASRVLRFRRSVTMEPMNAFERHVVHEALQTYNGVSTHSTGTEPHRCVIVSRGNGKGGGRYGNR
jgi:spoIIIJ-associated protein